MTRTEMGEAFAAMAKGSQSTRRDRLHVAVNALPEIEAWCADRGIFIQCFNSHVHWRFALPDGDRYDWWPSTKRMQRLPPRRRGMPPATDWGTVREILEKELAQKETSP